MAPSNSDDYVDPSRRLPAVRLVAAVSAVTVVALLPHRFWPYQFGVGLVLVALSFRQHFSWRSLARGLVRIWPIALLISAGWIGQPHWMIRMLDLLLKAGLSFWIMSLLVQATSLQEWIAALRQLRLPGLWIDLFTFWSRYFVVLGEEWTRMQWARKSRSVNPSRAREFLQLAHLLGFLFLRAYQRAERVYQAMQARGYQK